MNTDIIMMTAILALGVGLIPQVYKNYHTKSCGVALGTTAITTAALWVLTWCFYDMKMWFSFGGCVTQGTLWSVILNQWLMYNRRKPIGCRSCKHGVGRLLRRATVCLITKKEHVGLFVCGRYYEKGR